MTDFHYLKGSNAWHSRACKSMSHLGISTFIYRHWFNSVTISTARKKRCNNTPILYIWTQNDEAKKIGQNPLLEQNVSKATEGSLPYTSQGSLEVEDFTTLGSLPSFIEPGDWQSVEFYQIEMLALWTPAQNVMVVAKPGGNWSYRNSLDAVILYLPSCWNTKALELS